MIIDTLPEAAPLIREGGSTGSMLGGSGFDVFLASDEQFMDAPRFYRPLGDMVGATCS